MIPLGLAPQTRSRGAYDLSVVPADFEPFAAALVSDGRRVEITAVVVALFFAKTCRSEDGEHLHWTAGLASGQPITNVGGVTARAASLAWVIANRRDMPSDHIGAPTCGDARCLSAAHVEARRRVVRGNTRPVPTAPRPMTIEELTPASLHRFAVSQFGADGFTPRPIEPRRPRRCVTPTMRQLLDAAPDAAPDITPIASPVSRVLPVPAIQRLDHESFLELPGVTAVTFRSGGTIVFTPRGTVEHETRVGALERAIDLMSELQRGAA